jgi:hypothetical protein
MLSAAAQHLISDIFQRDDLFGDLPVIRKRVVAWGAAPVTLEHSAVVVSEEVLLDRLGTVSGDAQADWTICAGPPLPAATVEHRFGSRVASVVKVEMKGDADACWIESLEDGWLFLNSGWLLAVGASAEALVERSELVQQQIAWLGSDRGEFPASPRIVAPLGGEGWISCGTAAMAFDPLCGDGTAHAVREAILACAVIRAADDAGDFDGLLAHYEGRLTAGFQRHLAQCRQFYSSGGGGAWWKSETQSVDEGLAWCAERSEAAFRYRLEGLELKRTHIT